MSAWKPTEGEGTFRPCDSYLLTTGTPVPSRSILT